MDEVREVKRKLLKSFILHSLPSIIRMIKSRNMRCVGSVARKVEKRNA
jgi:hypothetical protein